MRCLSSHESLRRFRLTDERPEHFTMVVFSRGLHCPIRRRYLTELDGDGRRIRQARRRRQRRELGHTRAAKTIWGLQHLNVGYGLSTDHARRWRLFISTSRGQTRPGVEEPALFSEPGLFLVRPDGTLYWSSISTMPSARPHFTEILTSLDFAIKNNYPARGEACEGQP